MRGKHVHNVYMNKSALYVFVCLTSFISACSPLGMLTGAGATAGVSATREGGISTAYSDAKIQIAINDLWFQYSVDAFRKLDLTVNQGRVLITGVVQDPEQRVEAVRLAWQPGGVKQVINEIRIDEGGGIGRYARDVWITTRIRSTITLDKNVKSINYSVDTVQGIVYLMGVAQNHEELNRVEEVARTTPDVRQVISYVKIAAPSEDGDE